MTEPLPIGTRVVDSDQPHLGSMLVTACEPYPNGNGYFIGYRYVGSHVTGAGPASRFIAVPGGWQDAPPLLMSASAMAFATYDGEQPVPPGAMEAARQEDASIATLRARLERERAFGEWCWNHLIPLDRAIGERFLARHKLAFGELNVELDRVEGRVVPAIVE